MSNLAARNELVNWPVAPAEHEIAHYDATKWKYRQYVEQIINSIPLGKLKKKPFFTISTNVLCADIQSSKDTVDPIDRDIYLPLEISITKWKLHDWTESGVLDNASAEKGLMTKVWMIHPGQPTSGSICLAREQTRLHKIDLWLESPDQNQYIETDRSKVMKEINSFLTPDRTVYSCNLKFVRQDLGCLKWLNRESGYKANPIKVFSLEDLYVVLLRRINPEMAEMFGQGIAGFRLDSVSDTYDPALQCSFHQTKATITGEDCCYCAMAVSFCKSKKMVSDVVNFSRECRNIPTAKESETNQSPTETNQNDNTKHEAQAVAS